MPQKAQALSNHEQNNKQKTRQQVANELDMLGQQQEMLPVPIGEQDKDRGGSASLTPSNILRLQRAIGNQATSQLLTTRQHQTFQKNPSPVLRRRPSNTHETIQRHFLQSGQKALVRFLRPVQRYIEVLVSDKKGLFDNVVKSDQPVDLENWVEANLAVTIQNIKRWHAQYTDAEQIDEEMEDEDELSEEHNESSSEVPDLTEKQVEAIKVAKANPKMRQEVLTHLMALLLKREDVISSNLSGQKIQVKCVYNESKGNVLALTEVEAKDGKLEESAAVIITVYASLFEWGPADIYSTLRHELIHMGQRVDAPDEEAKGTDPNDRFIHEDNYENLNNSDKVNKNRTTAINNNVQIPLQEIETHTWEILNEANTGISQQYYQATCDFLVDYATKLINYANRLHKNTKNSINMRLINYWKGYIQKARDYVGRALNHVRQLISVQTPKRALQPKTVKNLESISVSLIELAK